MAKFNATVEFSLTTEIEPEGVRFDSVEDIDGVSDFEDQCRFGAQNVTADGGTLSFEITADDEGAARDLIEEVIFENQEHEDHNGFTWLVENLNIDLDEVEEEEQPPTVEEAIVVLRDFINRHFDSSGVVDDDENGNLARAAMVVLDDHARLGDRVAELSAQVRESREQIAGLSESVRRLTGMVEELQRQVDGQSTQ